MAIGVIVLTVASIMTPLSKLEPAITPTLMANLPNPLSSLLQEAIDAMGNTLSISQTKHFDSVGRRLAQAEEGGYVKHHPVVMVPGVVSTGLHLWQGLPCASSSFRARIWGSSQMLTHFVSNKACWLDHICLDKDGSDPEGIRVRAAESLTAADYFLPGFWVWAKLIANLAHLGYDSNSMFMASYDWRLSPETLQTRDAYFSKLKNTIETAHAIHNERPVLIGHSLGGNVVRYFLRWVEDPNGGNGGPHWVNTHVESFVNIGGPLLGVPKAISSLASGEMRNTAHFGLLEGLVLDRVFARTERMRMFRSWFSISYMLPKGGSLIWGTPETGAPDDVVIHADKTWSSCNLTAPSPDFTRAPLVTLAEPDPTSGKTELYGDDLPGWMASLAPEYWEEAQKLFSFGHDNMPRADETPEAFRKRTPDRRTWTNVLENQLPQAPDTTVYCLYGVGLPTERSYQYQPSVKNISGLEVEIDKDITALPQGLINGVQDAVGDGTVPLVSLGLMCVDRWKTKAYNPSGLPVVTREYQHQQSLFDPRGGPGTADHVDLLGNLDLIQDIIRIVARPTNVTDSSPDADPTPILDDRIVSPILDIAERIQWP